jgi:NAD(P)-dependent dehydrogenase (short-subunit alcohol dehydrogenase family)
MPVRFGMRGPASVLLVALHALKRLAQPSEINAAAVLLASDEATFVTDSTMVVDGGYLAGK